MSNAMSSLPADILRLIFEHHTGDYATLRALSLTCRTWRTLAEPALFHHVDLSSHNLGRQPEHECEIMPVIYADFEGRYRPSDSDLVPRQRAFLRRMVASSELAKYVKSFTWTFIWLDFDEEELQDIDRRTWEVLGRLNSVTHLDLASLHDVHHDEYVREIPAKLFPAVRYLRLSGHMHRALVRVICASLDASKLCSLRLDYLQEEGALPDGSPMDDSFAQEQNPHCVANRSLRWDLNLRTELIGDDLLRRQESGAAFTFPGPMWLPCYLMASQTLRSLKHLQVMIVPYSRACDLRNYSTMFDKVCKLLTIASTTLESIEIVLSEPYSFSLEGLNQPGICGTGRARARSARSWVIRLAALLLEEILTTLDQNESPRLGRLQLKGFDVLENVPSSSTAASDVADVMRLVDCSRFDRHWLLQASSIDHRWVFGGFEECEMPSLERFKELLAAS